MPRSKFPTILPAQTASRVEVIQFMIAQINVETQALVNFGRARRRALIRRLRGAVRKDTSSLLAFEEVRRSLGVLNRLPLARTETVEVKKIVGSVGRRNDFDACFLPVRSNVSSRWERVDSAFQRGEELPPVSLYKMGDAYFVNDGNHRVSVARFHGVESIDAEVVTFRSPRVIPNEILGTLPNCSGLMSRIKDTLRPALFSRKRSSRAYSGGASKGGYGAFFRHVA
jgi:hypothetical protein